MYRYVSGFSRPVVASSRASAVLRCARRVSRPEASCGASGHGGPPQVAVRKRRPQLPTRPRLLVWPRPDRNVAAVKPSHAPAASARTTPADSAPLPPLSAPASHPTAPSLRLLPSHLPPPLLDASPAPNRPWSARSRAGCTTSSASVPDTDLGQAPAPGTALDAPLLVACAHGQTHRDVVALLALRCAASSCLSTCSRDGLR